MIFKDELETLFIHELTEGMNLFIGAGFSLLPDNNGNSLPTASELCKEVCERFNVEDIFYDDIYAVSEMVPKKDYQIFLRNRFKTRSEINSKYKLLDKLNIKCIITTNIDDIIHKVYRLTESSTPQHFLITQKPYGRVRNDENGVYYLPLHGDVCDEESVLYFGKFELSDVESRNKDLFDTAQEKLDKAPVLFWGYSFNDTGVQKLIKKLLDSNKHSNIWVQCIKSDQKQIVFFEKMGCKVIIADTNEFFDWIENSFIQTISENLTSNDTLSYNTKVVNKYRIPTPFSVATNSIEQYYKHGDTHWFSIFNNHPYETSLVDKLWTKSLLHKNLVFIGDSFSGKTTALMQCAAKRNNESVFYFNGDTIVEEAEFFLKHIKGKKIIVFLQDIHKDINVFCFFAKEKDVKIIATADRYIFENVKHIIQKQKIEYQYEIVGSIDCDTARLVYNHIPKQLQQNEFTYTENALEEYSYIELLGQNVQGFITKEKVVEMLSTVNNSCNDNNAVENRNEILLIALTVYLERHDSLMSTDLFFSFFEFNDYFTQIEPLVKSVKGLLIDSTEVDSSQDYFLIRSKFFLQYAELAFVNDENLREIYKYTISKFVKVVPKRNVCRYDSFKRKAYDSKLFYKLFNSDAIDLYDTLYNADNNPYTLQQKALCLSLLKRSKEAFSSIEEALSYLPNNFSIKNSKAEIIFNANKTLKTEDAHNQLDNAISILEDCKTNDKKQNYHAMLYAKIALHLNSTFNCGIYLKSAYEWLSSLDLYTGDKALANIIKEVEKILSDVSV